MIAVTSGKGGVGKTNVSINLATALSKRGRSVMLLDADLGLANVDVVLGLKAHRTLAHVLDGECDLEDVIIDAPGDLRVVPASSGVQRMARLGVQETASIIHAFGGIRRPPDTLIVDTAAGINDSVASFVCAASDVLVVVCDEPASITDAYASAMAGIGVRVQGAASAADISAAVSAQADATRSAKSGVNLDEEAANLVRFQQAYQASAKIPLLAEAISMLFFSTE